MLDLAATLPVRVPLHTEPMGVVASFRAARRNVLELIPEIATQVPILSGRTGKRWHMLMDPDALKQVLRDKVDDYPKSVVTKLILEPAIGDSLFVAEGAQWMWQRRTAAPVFSPPQRRGPGAGDDGGGRTVGRAAGRGRWAGRRTCSTRW